MEEPNVEQKSGAAVEDPDFKVQDKTTPETKLKNQKTVYVEARSRDENKTYSGEFTFRRLPLGLISRVGVRVARLNGGLNVDFDTNLLNTALAHLEFAVVKAPEWWVPQDMFDMGIVLAVYAEVMAFEATFRASLREQPSGSKEDSAA